MKTYPLTFDQVLNLLRLNPEMRFQGENFVPGFSLVCDTDGLLKVSVISKSNLRGEEDTSDYVVSVMSNQQKYRSVLTADELFSS